MSILYVIVAIGLTVWLAQTLHHSGTAFLRDVFADKPDLADAINRLLVVGLRRTMRFLPAVSRLARSPAVLGRRRTPPAGSPAAQERYGAVPWLGSELVVADAEGNVWVGPAAFLMCLWATAHYRSWAYLLSRPGWPKHAERFFAHVSKRCSAWARWIGRKEPDCSWCDDVRMRWDA